MTAKEFKMIYDTHFDNLRRYLYYKSGDQYLSQDIAQDVFLKIWKKKIEINQGNIKGLLFKMGSDNFITHYRRSKVEREFASSQKFELIYEEDEEQNFEKKKMFEKALGLLSEKQRIALLMNKIQGLTHKEIAETLNLSQKAIEKRIGQALAKLREKLKRQ